MVPGNGSRFLYFLLSTSHCQRLPSTLLYSTLRSLTSTSTSTKEGKLSNFLVEFLGFSKHQSLSTSIKLVKLRQGRGAKNLSDSYFDYDNANSVIDYLKLLGFHESNIRALLNREPRILVSSVAKTLEPKVKLLLELGFSGSELVSAVSRNPQLITHCLGPAIHAFRTVLGSDENVISVLKRTRRRRLSLKKAAEFLVPNVTLLQNDYGIPCDKIQKYIVQQSNPFIERTDLFRDMLIRVEEELGITRDSTMFVYGIHLVAYYTKEQLEDKFRIFRSFGWDQSDVTTLIKRHPMCLTSTQARIKERLDFLMNEMGYKPDYLTSQPCLFICGVKKRLLPRHKVLQTLKEKGHIRMDYSLSTAACFSDPAFLKRFILPFEEVHEVYAELTGSTVASLTAGRAIGNTKDVIKF
ncbi:hypothetical protein BVRB_7g157180 [Beta vulgaris subsp. vulgaris]|nr:hypothetical protein BVRB_7g157180 [Beta vulgaris subsp. vulgaris]